MIYYWHDLPLIGILYSPALRKDFKTIRIIFTCVACTIFYFIALLVYSPQQCFGFGDNPRLPEHPPLSIHTTRGSAEVRLSARTYCY